MKNTLRLSVFVALFATMANASERELLQFCAMEVADASNGFEDVTSDVFVDLDRELSTMVLDYAQGSENRHVLLHVYRKEVGGCGSTNYLARLPSRRGVNEHYTVILVDHSTRRCRDLKRYLWEAEVRSGDGLVDTSSDAVMTLRGFDRGHGH